MKKQVCEILEKFGGVRSTGKILDVSPFTVSAWKRNGRIPVRHFPKIREAAEKHLGEEMPDELLFRAAE